MTSPENPISWWGLCTDAAKPYVSKAVRHAEQSNGLFNMPAGAEFDDLVQIGMEKVVELLGKGVYPTRSIIDQTLSKHLRDVFHLRARTDV